MRSLPLFNALSLNLENLLRGLRHRSVIETVVPKNPKAENLLRGLRPNDITEEASPTEWIGKPLKRTKT